ncbi:MAG: polysaccharide deacetylase family protein [Myxococcales bacterium]|nr:polysaccharide deacetylase family protein [Myxococcales bacterium]
MIAIWSVLGLVILIFVVPFYALKELGIGILQRASTTTKAIGLTFDDGPDPTYTPRVLELLAQYGVKATFFVIGERVEAHPDLVRRIALEGHELASHSYTHRNALFERRPLQGWFDTRLGIHKLEKLLGKRTRWFRAPFGIYSWSVLAAIHRSRLVAVNWSIESRDWHPAFTPADVKARVLSAAHSGGIIVMHDGGRGGAKTIHALEGVLQGLAERGFMPGPLSALELRS